MKRAKKLAKLVSCIAAAAMIVAGAAATGCSGGYGDPTEPDTTQAARR